MKPFRYGNAGVDRMSDNQAGLGSTFDNMRFSSIASGIDALEKCIQYHVDLMKPRRPNFVLIINAFQFFTNRNSANQ